MSRDGSGWRPRISVDDRSRALYGTYIVVIFVQLLLSGREVHCQ